MVWCAEHDRSRRGVQSLWLRIILDEEMGMRIPVHRAEVVSPVSTLLTRQKGTFMTERAGAGLRHGIPSGEYTCLWYYCFGIQPDSIRD